MKDIIKQALKDLTNLYYGKGDGYLIFPKKRDGTTRVSEQEARFLLVKHLEKNKCRYAVEAPTMLTYRFTGKKELSGNIDICVYKNEKRSNLVELKANNYRNNHLSNDFEKLFFDINEETDRDLHNYFIHILENNNPNMEKYFNAGITTAIEKKKDNKKKSNVTIFLCILKTKEVKEYKIDNNHQVVEL